MKQALRCWCALAAFTGILWTGANAAESASSWRVFNKNDNTWVYHPGGLMLFSALSRTVKPVVIDAVRKIDTLTDCIEYDDYLWVLANTGLYQIDMASQSGERIPLPDDVNRPGKLAQDMDYLWLSTNDTLFQFDKLGREWLSFAYPAPVEDMVGLWSNGDEVFALGRKMLYRFTTSTEKWNKYELDAPLGAGAVFYPGAGSFKVIDGSLVMRYQPESFSWLKTGLGEQPVDIFDNDDVIYCTDGTKVKQVNCATGMVKPLNISNVQGIGAITVAGDSVMMVTPGRIAAFAMTPETMNYTEYEKGYTPEQVLKILPLQSFVVMVTGASVVVYEKSTKAWQYIPRSGLKQKVKAFSWNEEEFALRFGGSGVKSIMSGSVEFGAGLQSAGYVYDTVDLRRDTVNGVGTWVPVVDSQPLFNFSSPNVYGDLTLHTTDKNDRVADVFFDNTSFITAPKKGIYYRGNRDDYLNTLRVGTTNNEQMASTVLPQVSMEGGSVVLESRKRLAKRDRKVARLAGGSGYITSKTITRQLPYRADGTYYLLDDADSSSAAETAIIPGTIKVMVDGAVLDTAYYTMYNSTGKLAFNTSSPVDPVSSLTVEYQVQPVPEGSISNVEFIPSNNFGKLHYGTFTLSPTEWISARVGYTGIDRDSLNSIISAATPFEFRSDKAKLMVKGTPEFSYNVNNGAKAGGATLQSRFGSKTGLLFNGRFADSNFVSTDTLTRGLGALRQEYDVKLNHDVRQELPLSYYQHQRFTDEGYDNRFEFNAGAHFTGYPFLDMTASRTIFEKNTDAGGENIFDSLFHKKDKVLLRLYETNSPLLERLTRFRKISYELSHSEYRSRVHGGDGWNPGRVTTFQFSLIPIQRIIMLGELLYRGSMEIEGAPSSDIIPRLSVQFLDFPKGIDVSVLYNINNKRFWNEQLSTDTIMRTVGIVLRPGQWFSPLGWFSPRAQISQNVRSTYSRVDLNAWEMMTGVNGDREADIVKEVGVNIFPFDGMMLTNTDRWSESSTRSGSKFQSINRLQLLFDARNIITANYIMSFDEPNSNHSALLMYEKIWTGWLRTSPAALLTAKTDSTGNVISAGPKLTFNLNFQDFAFIRMLNNIQDVQLQWNRVDGDIHSTPDFGYNFSLRMKLRPNLELANVEQLQFKEGVFSNFISRLNLFVYF